jgi:hypothetical protein
MVYRQKFLEESPAFSLASARVGQIVRCIHRLDAAHLVCERRGHLNLVVWLLKLRVPFVEVRFATALQVNRAVARKEW